MRLLKRIVLAPLHGAAWLAGNVVGWVISKIGFP